MKPQVFDLKPLLAELVATFGLVYIGGMAVMQADIGNLDLLGVALAHLIVLSILVYFSGPISGGHLNPAVTIGFVLTRKMYVHTGVFYIIFQLLGSILAGGLLLLTAGSDLLEAADDKSVLGYPQLAAGYDPISGMLLEAIMTFFLVFVIWAVAVDTGAPDSIYGLAIGGAVAFDILVGGPQTGAALNPARVFGPALFSLDFSHHWIYWVGPILGGVIAAFLYMLVFLDKPEK